MSLVTELSVYRMIKAVGLAARSHASQRRKNQNQDPYINHPIQVCEFLNNASVSDQDVLIAALLHDTGKKRIF
jgi:(p)ppGpp synthase/HD superfamily hydrolase